MEALTESVSTPTIAMPAPEISERKAAFVIMDENLGEPFTVYESANAWWMKVEKVEKLMHAFKLQMKVVEALVFAGISADQYKYFLKIHPEFIAVKQACYAVLSAQAKVTLATGLKSDSKLALRYLQGTQPDGYNRRVMPELPGPGTYTKQSEEAFMDEAGNLVMSRKTAEIIQSMEHGDSDSTSNPGE